MASIRSARLVRTSRLLAMELIIVFVGVYGAFWVDNYRDQKEQEATAELLAEALRQDLRDYVEVTGRMIGIIDTGLGQWEAQRSRGERPPPFAFRITGAETPPVATWDAVRQAEAAKLFEPGLLFDLGFFYNEISGMAQRYVRYAIFTEAEVLPRLLPGGATFYADETGQLLPQFAAHMDLLREYRQFMVETIDWSSCLLRRLETPRQLTESCRGDAGVTTI